MARCSSLQVMTVSFSVSEDRKSESAVLKMQISKLLCDCCVVHYQGHRSGFQFCRRGDSQRLAQIQARQQDDDKQDQQNNSG
jgi:hypothetical protein